MKRYAHWHVVRTLCRWHRFSSGADSGRSLRIHIMKFNNGMNLARGKVLPKQREAGCTHVSAAADIMITLIHQEQLSRRHYLKLRQQRRCVAGCHVRRAGGDFAPCDCCNTATRDGRRKEKRSPFEEDVKDEYSASWIKEKGGDWGGEGGGGCT